MDLIFVVWVALDGISFPTEGAAIPSLQRPDVEMLPRGGPARAGEFLFHSTGTDKALRYILPDARLRLSSFAGTKEAPPGEALRISKDLSRAIKGLTRVARVGTRFCPCAVALLHQTSRLGRGGGGANRRQRVSSDPIERRSRVRQKAGMRRQPGSLAERLPRSDTRLDVAYCRTLLLTAKSSQHNISPIKWNNWRSGCRSGAARGGGRGGSREADARACRTRRD